MASELNYVPGYLIYLGSNNVMSVSVGQLRDLPDEQGVGAVARSTFPYWRFCVRLDLVTSTYATKST